MTNFSGKRAALYARYSTDMQNDKSVEDQCAELREFAARHSIKVVAEYHDREKTSQTLLNRVGLWDMMEAAKNNRFDLVLIESPSRLSRNTADGFRIKNSLEFRDIEIVAIQQGVMDDTQLTIHGLVGGEFIKQLKTNTRRGQKGRAREGKVVASHCYGYRPVPGRPGEPEIVPEQAEIIRRIFNEYISGESPRTIARRLKAEGHPSPGRGGWSHKNIITSRSPACRGGILANPLYKGELRWGDTYKKFNHETGKAVNRRNTKEAPVVHRVEHLRIVGDEVWEAAHRVMDARVRTAGAERKPWSKNTSLLAGLCRCICGSHMIVAQRGRGKVPRIKCSAAHFKDACPHTMSYDQPRLEKAIRERLAEHLADEPKLESELNAYWDEYKTTFLKRQKEALRTKEVSQKRMREIEAATNRLISHLESGTMASELIESRLQELAVERASIEERERVAGADLNVIPFHPATAIKKYRETVEALQKDLSGDTLKPEDRIAFRNIVESITILPTSPRKPYEYQIHGYLGALLGLDLHPPVQPVDEIIRERGGPVCADSVQSASTLSTISHQVICFGTWVERAA